MSLKIRLARGGARQRPYYRIVIANSTSPRDGRFIERVGSYNPMLSNDHEQRVVLNEERVRYWVSVGAQPTEAVGRFLVKAKIIEATPREEQPLKSKPRKRAQERLAAAAQA